MESFSWECGWRPGQRGMPASTNTFRSNGVFSPGEQLLKAISSPAALAVRHAPAVASTHAATSTRGVPGDEIERDLGRAPLVVLAGSQFPCQ
jgi:hypothetical protein